MMEYFGYGSNLVLGLSNWIMLLSIVSLIIVAIKINLQPPRQSIPVDNRSLEEQILEQEYARGKISIEEYEYNKALLRR